MNTLILLACLMGPGQTIRTPLGFVEATENNLSNPQAVSDLCDALVEGPHLAAWLEDGQLGK